MNERHLFRGKYVGAGDAFVGKWVEGDHVVIGGESYIHPQCNTTGLIKGDLAKLLIMHPVDPVSVGQRTGLRDHTGALIFEGDVLTDGLSDGAVEWRDGGWCLCYPGKRGLCDNLVDVYSDSWIIGNIYDNPELLKGGGGG